MKAQYTQKKNYFTHKEWIENHNPGTVMLYINILT